MKLSFLLLAATLFLSLPSLAQTYEQETAWISKSVEDKTITPPQALESRKALLSLIKAGLYPVLPYDTSRQEVVFEHVLECPGASKAAIFRRIKEWCAIAYGDFETPLRYEDFESGKIVAKGYVYVSFHEVDEYLFWGGKPKKVQAACKFGVAFTVRDEKFKISLQQLSYAVTFDGYLKETTYIPPKLIEYHAADVFPIASVHPDKRKGMLEMVRNTLTAFDASRAGLLTYVKAWQEDDKF